MKGCGRGPIESQLIWNDNFRRSVREESIYTANIDSNSNEIGGHLSKSASKLIGDDVSRSSLSMDNNSITKRVPWKLQYSRSCKYKRLPDTFNESGVSERSTSGPKNNEPEVTMTAGSQCQTASKHLESVISRRQTSNHLKTTSTSGSVANTPNIHRFSAGDADKLAKSLQNISPTFSLRGVASNDYTQS